MRGIRLDQGEAMRLAGDCRRVADVIDRQVALLRGGDYAALRDRRRGGYRPAVEAVAGRLAGRAVELRAAARGLTAHAASVSAADGAAARRILDLAGRGR
ncbi:MAG: hypothetical protein QM728_04220 [Gordonia sp. (in: high G+C Gram-positive bacteria)]|uniref:hypothetical protein n=1 Tax=Gordonia sp. (in: high G+C Gram-positive bacteria) TaxID=84139 RepID=UPI0039E2689A